MRMTCRSGFAGSTATPDADPTIGASLGAMCAGTGFGAGGAGEAATCEGAAESLEAGRTAKVCGAGAADALGAIGAGNVTGGSLSDATSASPRRKLAWSTSLGTCNASVTVFPLVATCNPFTTPGNCGIDFRMLPATSAAPA